MRSSEPKDAARYQAYFLKRIEEADSNAAKAHLVGWLVEASLAAGHADAEIQKLATESWQQAWEESWKAQGFEGSSAMGDSGKENSAARVVCEAETEQAFHVMVRAAFLAGDLPEDGHPLWNMEGESTVRFEDITPKTGLEGLIATRLAAADFDQDGDPDLCFGGRLFKNRKGKFTEVGPETGITHTGTGALFGDFDGDGALDLLVTAHPHPFLYRNLGKKGKFAFEDITQKAGLASLVFEHAIQEAAWIDADADGDLDLYLSVDGKASSDAGILLINQGDGSFLKSARADDGYLPLHPNVAWRMEEGHVVDRAMGLSVVGASEKKDLGLESTVGSTWGDLDGDGDLDLFSPNRKLSTFGSPESVAETLLAIRFQSSYCDPAFIDVDHDGDLDLSLTAIGEGVSSSLYANDGSGHFTPITVRSGLVATNASGQAWADIDGDGFLDVIFASEDGVRVFRNSGNRNSHLRVQLKSKGLDPHAFGALAGFRSRGNQAPEGEPYLPVQAVEEGEVMP